MVGVATDWTSVADPCRTGTFAAAFCPYKGSGLISSLRVPSETSVFSSFCFKKNPHGSADLAQLVVQKRL